jgi:NADPH-dependent glutamate synthase beta subunit-like oxidoreductase
MPKPVELTPILDLTEAPGTGPKRTRRPLYRDLLPPCRDACPAGEDVQGWLDLAQAGRYRAAFERLVAENPLPATHGRVCYHPCESACNRGSLDAPVSIHAVERFLGDLAIAEGWPVPAAAAATGKSVLVIGAGPSGLSAAYHLRRLGHAVTLHEAGPVAGGMLHFGIPAYRLPRAELAREVARIEAIGVSMMLNHKVEDVLAEKDAGQFNAVFVAIGAQRSQHVDIPARDAGRVLEAVSLLRNVSGGERPLLGRRIVVYGGGNTAMDAARTAKRLGATETLIVYRRDRAHMPAHEFEADEALAEGIKIRWLTTIRDIAGSHLTVERMTLDDTGRPHPTGEVDTLSADALVLAVGQVADSTFLHRVPGVEIQPDGSVQVGGDLMTGHPGIFAGGDAIPAERSVTVAVGHGKRAARHIDGWLRGTRHSDPARAPLVSFAMLNLPLFSDAEPARQRELPIAERIGFTEIMAGLQPTEAKREAKRCLSCGVCFECDNCWAACPEDAIIKLGPGSRYRIDHAKCTGCAVCVEQCPCHAMEMVAEPEDA